MPKPLHSAFRTLPQILICTLLIGCPARKPATSPPPSTAPAYHLTSINGGSLLLSPNIPAQQAADASISFILGANTETPAANNACSIVKGTFRLEPNIPDKNLHVVLPPSKNWLFGSTNSSGADENNIIDSLYEFLAAIDQADRAGCFAPSTQPRDTILQNVPTRPSDSLFNVYGYRIERSGVNLKASLRLKVERAYFSTTDKSDKNYLGVSTVLFDVTTNSDDGSLCFQQSQPIHYNPDSLSQTDNEGSRDLAILNLKPQKLYRVLFYTHQVPTDQNFTAALIGSDDPTRLDEFEQSMRTNAAASCSSSPHDNVQCMEFRGFATVSVQILVELNGQPKYIDWGTKVDSIVPQKSLKSLKINRLFANSYFPIQLAPTDPAILDLTLVGADHLSW